MARRDIYRDAIASIESGGDYDIVGPTTRGDRPYGRYQIMGNNIPVWTEQVLGYAMTPEQFLAAPWAQDRVFDEIFGGYVDDYGEEAAAQAWFAGPGSIGRADASNREDVLGTSVKEYVDNFMEALGKEGEGGGIASLGRGFPILEALAGVEDRPFIQNMARRMIERRKGRQQRMSGEGGLFDLFSRLREWRELRQGRNRSPLGGPPVPANDQEPLISPPSPIPTQPEKEMPDQVSPSRLDKLLPPKPTPVNRPSLTDEEKIGLLALRQAPRVKVRVPGRTRLT